MIRGCHRRHQCCRPSRGRAPCIINACAIQSITCMSCRFVRADTHILCIKSILPASQPSIHPSIHPGSQAGSQASRQAGLYILHALVHMPALMYAGTRASCSGSWHVHVFNKSFFACELKYSDTCTHDSLHVLYPSLSLYISAHLAGARGDTS